MNAIVGAGVDARENNGATPAYSGNLTVEAGGTMRVYPSSNYNAVGNGNVYLKEGSRFTLRLGVNHYFDSFTLLGNAFVRTGESSTGHSRTVRFPHTISGNYKFTLEGINNNNNYFDAENSFSEFFGSTAGGTSNCKVYANAANSLGTGNVTIDTSVTLFIMAANTISDSADLYLVGGPQGSNEKLEMTADETVNKLYIDGFQQAAGNYTNTETWIDGAGTLTVLTNPPVVAPTVTSMEDDVQGGPIYEDFSEVNFTVTFDLEIDSSTLSGDDFENGGTASVNIGSITQTSLNVFSIQALPLSSGNLVLQIKSGANIRTPIGGALDTTSPIPDDTNILINAGNSPELVITGTANGPAGSDDKWNLPANWSTNIIPNGPYHARVADGISIGEDNNANPTTPVYTGNLTIGAGSTLSVSHRNVTTKMLGNGNIRLLEGASLYTGGFSYTYGEITLLGNATIQAANNNAHRDDKFFNSPITGDYQLSIAGANDQEWNFNAANSFSAFAANPGQANGYRVRATSAGSMGASSVSINDSVSLWIETDNVMSDSTILYLNGTKSDKATDLAKIHMDADATVLALYVDGVRQSPGVYGSTSSSAPPSNQNDTLFNGTGTLRVKANHGTIVRVK